jgi:hypothetical protein
MTAPVRPKAHLDSCTNCSGSGLVPRWVLHCRYRKLPTYYWWRYRRSGTGCGLFAPRNPFTLYERDSGFEAVSGYGLTLQQASKAMRIGYFIRRRSDFHQTFGSYYRWKSNWGMGNESGCRPIKVSQAHQYAYRTAVLRLALLEQLGGHDAVQDTNWSILRKQKTYMCHWPFEVTVVWRSWLNTWSRI